MLRIPLDYYRILGLPIQAQPEQLEQAYNDRTLQLPRREYSELAIASRKQLLDDAYAVLSNPELRSHYDARLLPHVETRSFGPVQSSEPGVESGSEDIDKPAESDFSLTPTLEIPPEKLLGALLILHEFGEYEQVLKLSRPYLGNGSLSISLDKGRLGDPVLVRADIVLTVASACLELGREQWRQGQYENAAESLQTGQKLLLSEGLFPSVRGEIQTDLYKLRPYRILELLALPEENVAERRLGLRLLQDMLQERGGIDGTGDDESGLSIDDFLRFIQQLRSYLTAVEQQALFETEAKRPSAVATYLAVYALMARGYGQRLPAPIVRAKKMLIRLGRRQDVHLEQAVCSLLLGQTEEASRALEQSLEYEPLAFIREHSQGSPDLLPGLCLYAERWLQTEVFPHFRDLASTRIFLKDYFADEQVQAYLEALSAEADTASHLRIVERQQESEPAVSAREPGEAESASVLRFPQSTESPFLHQQHAFSNGNTVSDPAQIDWEEAVEIDPVLTTTSPSVGATLTSTNSPESVSGGSTRSLHRRAAESPTQQILTPREPANATTSSPRESSPPRRRARERSRHRFSASLAKRFGRKPASVPQASPGADASPPRSLPHPKRRRANSKSSPKIGRLILLAVAGIVGVGILGLLAIGTYNLLHKTFNNSSAPPLKNSQPIVRGDRLPNPSPSPSPSPSSVSPEAALTEETALILIQTWLASKAEALGQKHQVDRLKQILAEPALSRWQKQVRVNQKNNRYWQYKHSVQVKSLSTSAANPDVATVEAIVNEAAQLYKKDRLDRSSSYNDQLRVKYDLVRQNGQWRISNMTVL